MSSRVTGLAMIGRRDRPDLRVSRTVNGRTRHKWYRLTRSSMIRLLRILPSTKFDRSGTMADFITMKLSGQEER